MDDSEITAHIEALIAEEHRLLDKGGLSEADQRRFDAINVQLDRYYDLLRQRRAKREFGDDPDTARLRPPGVVEKYLQ